MSPSPIDSQLSGAHEEHSVIVSRWASPPLHDRGSVTAYRAESVVACMSSQLEVRAVMPTCSKRSTYDHKADSRPHNSSRG
jgi:hypothetical protein